MDKAEERYYLDICLKLMPQLAVSSIQETEAPDFLAIADDDQIGIELVRFVFEHGSGRSPAAVHNYRNQLGRRLRGEHITRQIPPVQVSVHFSHDEVLLSRKDRANLAERLLTFISANIPAQNSSVEFGYDTLPSEIYDLGVSRLNVLRSVALTDPFWAMPHAGYLPESTAERVQSLIDKKALHVAAYRRRAPQLWLIIISGTQGLQSILDLDGGLLEASYETEFDRLFLFRAFGGTFHELKRQKPIAA